MPTFWFVEVVNLSEKYRLEALIELARSSPEARSTAAIASVMPSRTSDGTLSPALDRLSGTIDRALQRATRGITVADLVQWERQTDRGHDYPI